MVRLNRWLWLALLAGCQRGPGAVEVSPGEEPDAAGADTAPPAVAPPFPGLPLTDAQLLRRGTLDLAGRLPTLEEIDRVEADPAAISQRLDELVLGEALEERLVSIYSEQWLMRVDTLYLSAPAMGIDLEQEYRYLRQIEEEPARLMARVAVADRPWSEIVTADWTMTTPLLASIWPVAMTAPDDGAGEWQVARYTDDRPALGVLGTNGMWWRYNTTPHNYNRARAAAVSRLLLCDDYLERPILFEASGILDAGSLVAAIRTEPTCVACHSTLDPIASALFGFWNTDLFRVEEQTHYHSERELLGQDYLGANPGWFGTPLTAPAALGPAIASDARFPRCTVETLATALWKRDIELADFTAISELTATFEADGMRLRPLLRALVETPDYQVGSLRDDAGDDDVDRLETLRLMPPSLVSTAVEDLTGFRWTREGWDRLDNDNHGFRTMAGGVDGDEVTRRGRAPTVSRGLLMRRFAQAAATHAVEQELGGSDADDTGAPAASGLLGGVSVHDRPGDPAFDEALVGLHRRLFGLPPSPTELEADLELWGAVYELDSDPMQAWRSLLAGKLRDPAFWTY